MSDAPSKPRAVVLAPGELGHENAKTANGLVLHARRWDVVGAVDATKAGRDAGDVVSGRPRGVPVFATLAEAIERARPDVVVVGVAPVGGVLPPAFRADIRLALERGLEVVSGLHTFLSDDPEFAAIAARTGARFRDVRRPPEGLRVADGRARHLAVPRIMVAGTDCDVGKRMATLEILKEIESRGLTVAFVATGQTGCMIGADAGAVIDRIPGDFMAGQVERMVCDVAERLRPDVILLYGQSSVTHPAYSGVAIACLHGAAPNALIVTHDPVRKERDFFPGIPVTPLKEEIDLLRRLGGAPIVGIAINGKHVADPVAEAHRMEAEHGVPARDLLKESAAPLVDAALAAVRLPLRRGPE